MKISFHSYHNRYIALRLALKERPRRTREMAYLSIIPPAEDTFEHNTLVSRVTPESIIHIVRPSSNVSEKIFSMMMNVLKGNVTSPDDLEKKTRILKNGDARFASVC